MKNMKKLASLLLALVMILALAAPAMAVGETTGTIKLSNAVPGQTYNAYRIFDLEGYGSTTDNVDSAPHSYTISEDSPWYDFVTGTGAGAAYVTITTGDNNRAVGYVVWDENKTSADDAKAFAEAALAYAKNNNITPDAFRKMPGDVKKDPAGSLTLTKDGQPENGTNDQLPLGYYLIDSSLGSLCTLDTNNRNVVVTEKNKRPTIDKDIPDPTGLKVGDPVTYEVVVKAMRGASSYKVTDTMTNLTFNEDSLKVQHKKADGTLEDYPSGKYTLTANADMSGFTLTFNDAYLKEITDALVDDASYDIVVTYTGTITAAALKEDKINNTASLEYGDNGTTSSTPNTDVPTPLYSFDLVKTDSKNVLLADAVFKLKDSEKNEIPVVLVEDDTDAEGNPIPAYYRPALTGETATEIKTNADTKLTFRGFGAGTYYLEETTAPAGYNKLKEDVTVTIEDSDLTATITPVENPGADDAKNTITGGVHVTNYTGAELPSTGGIGTTLFYIVGGLLIVGAAVLLITKKRVNGEQ